MKKNILIFLMLSVVIASNAQTKRSSNDIILSQDEFTDKENKPHITVEQMPEFKGGEQEMGRFISQNLRYPIQALRNNTQGRVIIRFVIDKQGNVQDPTILRGIGSGCDEEAIRVVQKMPRWTPGKVGGKPVSVWFTLPINFTIAK